MFDYNNDCSFYSYYKNKINFYKLDTNLLILRYVSKTKNPIYIFLCNTIIEHNRNTKLKTDETVYLGSCFLFRITILTIISTKEIIYTTSLLIFIL